VTSTRKDHELSAPVSPAASEGSASASTSTGFFFADMIPLKFG